MEPVEKMERKKLVSSAGLTGTFCKPCCSRRLDAAKPNGKTTSFNQAELNAIIKKTHFRQLVLHRSSFRLFFAGGHQTSAWISVVLAINLHLQLGRRVVEPSAQIAVDT